MEESIWLIVLIAIAPGLFWLWYFYHKDKFEPEPIPLLLKTFLFGAFIAIPAFILELVSDLVVTGIFAIILTTPIIEEFCKFYVVKKSVFTHTEFDEPMDGIIYAVSAALGFATLENIEYIFLAPTFSDVLQIGTVRALLSVPGHALFAVPWGYALGIAKFRPNEKQERIIIGGLVVGMVFHGLFNFLLLGDYIGVAILIIIALPLMWRYGEGKIRSVLAKQ